MDILKHLKSDKGFIAALDQSGGSSKKTLINYGYKEEEITDDIVMFDYIHEMRRRIITDKSFNDEYILGAILFKNTMKKDINGINTVKYLREKNIPSFLKIDIGLDNLCDGVQLLKDIPNLDNILDEALQYGIVGTKMRSVIKEYNEYGIKKIVDQQFDLAKKIISKGLIPIIEPEVDINSINKKNIESFLKKELMRNLDKMSKDQFFFFFLTLLDLYGFYDNLLSYRNVLRIVALSGGYSKDKACDLLKNNKKMVASFSRALLEGLSIKQTDEEFSEKLANNIKKIFDASINKI